MTLCKSDIRVCTATIQLSQSRNKLYLEVKTHEEAGLGFVHETIFVHHALSTGRLRWSDCESLGTKIAWSENVLERDQAALENLLLSSIKSKTRAAIPQIVKLPPFGEPIKHLTA